jgi:hypothetical protein
MTQTKNNGDIILPIPRDVDSIRRLIETIESVQGARFFGLENVTAKGVRRWSLAPVPPRKAVAAIKGTPRKPRADHLLTRWAADSHGWRTVDLTTVRSIWHRVRGQRYVYRVADRVPFVDVPDGDSVTRIIVETEPNTYARAFRMSRLMRD